MATYRTKGIIIKRTDFAEADRILTIFTSSVGKITAIAKGCRRITSKMGGHLELFNVADMMLAEGRNMDTLTSVQTIFSYVNIRKDLNKTSQAYYLIELIDKLTPDEYKDTRVFNLSVKALDLIDKSKLGEKGLELITQTFKMKLLQVLGFEPQLEKCVQCSEEARESEVFCFSNLMGGIVCHNCMGHDKLCFELTPIQLKILRVIMRDDLSLIARLDLENKEAKRVNFIIDEYIKNIIEKEPRSLGFIRKVERLK